MNKTMWIVIGVVVLALLIGVGIWHYSAMQNSGAYQQPGTTSSTNPVAGPGEHCGGNMTTAPTCGQGYQCEPVPGSHLPFGDVGGICTAIQIQAN